MQIAVDAMQSHLPLASVGLVQRELVRELCRLDTSHTFSILTTVKTGLDVPKSGSVRVIELGPGGLFSWRRNVRRRLERDPPDVFLATFNISPRVPPRTRLLLLSMDLSHGREDLSLPSLTLGQFYRYWHLRSIRRADSLIALSSHGADELRKIVGRERPVHVVSLDCDRIYKETTRRTMDAINDGLGLPAAPYFLYVGRLRPSYKNIGRLISAFRAVRPELPDHRLVMVHNDRPTIWQAYLAKNPASGITLVRDIPTEALSLLYRSACCLVYPSRYEGFGIPLLEAQNSDCPVIANRLPPMTEVAGHGAVYYDGSAPDLARQMVRVARFSEAERRVVVDQGRINAGRFGWSHTARQVLACLEATART